MKLSYCKNYTTSSHAPSSHTPTLHRINHHPTHQSSIGSTFGSTSTSHLLFRNLYPSYVWDAASSHLHPIITLFFYRLFRKVYAMSNRMYLFLPIDRFLRTRSRNLLMYLDPLVSLRFSSFELVLSCLASYLPYSVPFLSYQSCLTLSRHPSHTYVSYVVTGSMAHREYVDI